MSAARTALCGALVMGAAILPAHALCPRPVPKVCSVFFASDAVFVGKVTKSEIIDSDRAVGEIRFRLEVGEVLRGHVPEVVYVTSENSSGRWIADEGKTYVVFEKNGKVGGTCGPLDDPARLDDTIREIRALKGARHASIEGSIHRGAVDGQPAGGVNILVTSGEVTRATVTQPDGSFRIAVPPGRYRFSAEGAVPSDYSFGNPGAFYLASGQCAQLDLVQP